MIYCPGSPGLYPIFGGERMRDEKEQGQAMVEFALVLPVLLLLLAGILDFGWIFGNQLLANNACREAARFTSVHYYDDTAAVALSNAESIVTNRAPTLDAPTVNLARSGETITLSVESELTVLTPFLSAILGETYNIESQCIMRLE